MGGSRDCFELEPLLVQKIAPGLAARLLAQFATVGGIRPDDPPQRPAPPGGEEPFSDRQLEVLALVAHGLSYREVGERVCLSPRTVKYHVGEMMRQLHRQSRAQVPTYAGALLARGGRAGSS